MSWNKNMILIDNPYYCLNKYTNGKFCPMGILNRDKYCILPCFFFDTPYCTYWISTYHQEKAAKEWEKNEK